MVHRVGSCVGEYDVEIVEMKCQEKRECSKRKENNIYLFVCMFIYMCVFHFQGPSILCFIFCISIEYDPNPNPNPNPNM